jgi:hypothetical protein
MRARFLCVLTVVGKVVGSVGLAGGILWFVAVHTGTSACRACVHVPQPDADVVMDEIARYHIATVYDSPVEFELRAGRHKLQMIRNSRVVYEEYFSLDAGEQTVLIAWERPEVQLPIPTHPPVLTHRRHERFRSDRTASR